MNVLLTFNLKLSVIKINRLVGTALGETEYSNVIMLNLNGSAKLHLKLGRLN